MERQPLYLESLLFCAEWGFEKHWYCRKFWLSGCHVGWELLVDSVDLLPLESRVTVSHCMICALTQVDLAGSEKAVLATSVPRDF